jgi:hypothetical protein
MRMVRPPRLRVRRDALLTSPKLELQVALKIPENAFAVQEEYLAFLKKHGAHFDEKYLWD